MQTTLKALIISTLAHWQISTLTLAQNQYNVWYFGAGPGYHTGNLLDPGPGLDFNSGSPVVLTNSAMGFTEGCATYCNSSGQLLFYTNGTYVWNANHDTMPNGRDLGAHVSSTQNSIVIPIAGDTNRYYLFSNDGAPTGNGTGLHYSIIDMTLSGGSGDVDPAAKAVPLLSNTSEKLAAARHCNGVDYWVITHLHQTNTYYAYHVSAAGIVNTVITSIGPVDNSGASGHIKVSPKNDKISVRINNGSEVDIFDFDNETGVLSNPMVLYTPPAFEWLGGTSFSPDGNLFYLTVTNSSAINQYLNHLYLKQSTEHQKPPCHYSKY